MRRLPLVIAAALACAAPSPFDQRWRIVGPGGGGSLYHPTVSPHDNHTALVACDMTGAYITHDGGATWRIFNLGDPVQFFVFDPIDAQVIYANAAGVFRSADAGATWQRFFPRHWYRQIRYLVRRRGLQFWVARQSPIPVRPQ